MDQGSDITQFIDGTGLYKTFLHTERRILLKHVNAASPGPHPNPSVSIFGQCAYRVVAQTGIGDRQMMEGT